MQNVKSNNLNHTYLYSVYHQNITLYGVPLRYK